MNDQPFSLQRQTEPKLIVANYGNDSVGLIQFAHSQKWKNTQILSIDTGWMSTDFQTRVHIAEKWAKNLGFPVFRLKASPDFSALVQAQEEFPSPKFQWCAVYLKGDTIRKWLNQHDPMKEMTVVLARRRAQSPLFFDLPEQQDHTEEYNERSVWNPLFSHNDAALQALISKTPLPWLSHRSLECDPCVNSDSADRARLKQPEKERLLSLEKKMGQTLFDAGNPSCFSAHSAHFIFDMGCGSPYGCGL